MTIQKEIMEIRKGIRIAQSKLNRAKRLNDRDAISEYTDLLNYLRKDLCKTMQGQTELDHNQDFFVNAIMMHEEVKPRI